LSPRGYMSRLYFTKVPLMLYFTAGPDAIGPSLSAFVFLSM
jgi:hypothetical protein